MTKKQIYQTNNYDPGSLQTRQGLHQYSNPPAIDLKDLVVKNISESGRHLDVGCGEGSLLKRIALKFPKKEMVGVDISPAMLDVAAVKLKDTKVCLIKADALSLPFNDNYFQTVSALHMVYALENIDLGLAEMKRVLQSNGKLIVTTNSQENRSIFFQPTINQILSEFKLKPFPDLSRRFSSEVALPKLKEMFDGNVSLINIEGSFSIPKEAYLSWFKSLSSFMHEQYGESCMRKIITRFSEELDKKPEQKIFENKSLGVFVCNKKS